MIKTHASSVGGMGFDPWFRELGCHGYAVRMGENCKPYDIKLTISLASKDTRSVVLSVSVPPAAVTTFHPQNFFILPNRSSVSIKR